MNRRFSWLVWALGLVVLTRLFGQNQAVTFTDIASQAGLARAINLSGSPLNKQFLLEEMGGGVALLDFDHDSLLDIVLVNGSSFLSVSGMPETDQLPVPQQRKHDVH